ncbi:LPXTG cell wall anchor domain-containing protein, partial [Vibrio parahaemolyticus]|nr:LPXTG cell wall anchor domain-containing protein [Vibrio parahaemolyticus]
ANILKDGDQLTATHVLYYEEEQKNEVGREDDLRNKDQTITLKKEKLLKQSILPKTNERRSLEMVLLGLSLIIIVSSYLYLQKKQKHVKL